MHHFWECVVAQRLREQMGVMLGAAGGAELAAVSRAQLWLVCAPAGVQQPVWDVVCLAAVAALDVGRQRLYAVRGGRSQRAPVSAVRRVGASVVADIFARLRSFAALGLVPRGWRDVPQEHPFLACSASGGVVFRGPPDVGDPDSDADTDA